MPNLIEAISFLYDGQRVVVKATIQGKFRVPVTEIIDGRLKTRKKALSALEIIKHEIIKNCDPTFYLSNNRRMRVFPGGDPSYLPAESEGLAIKHDQAKKPRPPKLLTAKKSSYEPASKFDYEQASLDMYGWLAGDDDGYAD